MAPIHPAVTFDLWHTLIYLPPEEEEAYMRRQIDAAVEVLECSPPDPGATIQASHDQLRTVFRREYVRAAEASTEGRTVTPVEQLAVAAAAAGRMPRPQAYLAALERILSATPFAVAPGALDVLRILTESGYRVGVISNTVGEPGRLLRPMLEAFGFTDYVREFTFSDEHPWTKPAPEIFHFAVRGLGSEPAATVHIGDGWSDIRGARGAGLRAGVLFTGLQEYGRGYRELFTHQTNPEDGPEFVVGDLAEVVPLVNRLLPDAAGTPTSA